MIARYRTDAQRLRALRKERGELTHRLKWPRGMSAVNHDERRRKQSKIRRVERCLGKIRLWLTIMVSLLVAACSTVIPIDHVVGSDEAEAVLAEWSDSYGESVDDPGYSVLHSEDVEAVCAGRRGVQACHKHGDIYVSGEFTGHWAGDRSQAIIHEYIHYLLWATGQDTDRAHTRTELWCGEHADQTCLLGRALERVR